MARTSLQALEDKCHTLMRMNLFLALLVLGIGYLWVSKEFAARSSLAVEKVVVQSKAGGPSAVVTAEGIAFLDASEQTVAEFGVRNGEPGFSLFRQTEEGCRLRLGEQQTLFVLEAAESRASLQVEARGTALRVTDTTGEATLQPRAND